MVGAQGSAPPALQGSRACQSTLGKSVHRDKRFGSNQGRLRGWAAPCTPMLQTLLLLSLESGGTLVSKQQTPRKPPAWRGRC